MTEMESFIDGMMEILMIIKGKMAENREEQDKNLASLTKRR
jgi:hypothetical protein